MNFKKAKNFYKSTKIPKELNQKISNITHKYESNKVNNNQDILGKINKSKNKALVLSALFAFINNNHNT